MVFRTPFRGQGAKKQEKEQRAGAKKQKVEKGQGAKKQEKEQRAGAKKQKVEKGQGAKNKL